MTKLERYDRNATHGSGWILLPRVVAINGSFLAHVIVLNFAFISESADFEIYRIRQPARRFFFTKHLDY